jgi:hypothetical protein
VVASVFAARMGRSRSSCFFHRLRVVRGESRAGFIPAGR